ncbi:hypothetical protein [Sphingomonas albertensis]|uniref:Uncharacterized protein n=1 Tax=Sphingomonas albertensis TaxID=2762591 RepID=A0ABR7AM44_9SPHN|nr:hypothetical protein [Sphingomonas albertensis]MBC3941532.1 hypothetical protein [Sphingomonas albertensis]
MQIDRMADLRHAADRTHDLLYLDQRLLHSLRPSERSDATLQGVDQPVHRQARKAVGLRISGPAVVGRLTQRHRLGCPIGGTRHGPDFILAILIETFGRIARGQPVERLAQLAERAEQIGREIGCDQQRQRQRSKDRDLSHHIGRPSQFPGFVADHLSTYLIGLGDAFGQSPECGIIPRIQPIVDPPHDVCPAPLPGENEHIARRADQALMRGLHGFQITFLARSGRETIPFREHGAGRRNRPLEILSRVGIAVVCVGSMKAMSIPS